MIKSLLSNSWGSVGRGMLPVVCCMYEYYNVFFRIVAVLDAIIKVYMSRTGQGRGSYLSVM